MIYNKSELKTHKTEKASKLIQIRKHKNTSINIEQVSLRYFNKHIVIIYGKHDFMTIFGFTLCWTWLGMMINRKSNKSKQFWPIKIEGNAYKHKTLLHMHEEHL